MGVVEDGDGEEVLVVVVEEEEEEQAMEADVRGTESPSITSIACW